MFRECSSGSKPMNARPITCWVEWSFLKHFAQTFFLLQTPIPENQKFPGTSLITGYQRDIIQSWWIRESSFFGAHDSSKKAFIFGNDRQSDLFNARALLRFYPLLWRKLNDRLLRVIAWRSNFSADELESALSRPFSCAKHETSLSILLFSHFVFLKRISSNASSSCEEPEVATRALMMQFSRSL